MSSDAAAPKQKLLILYGSETGNAESISKRLHHDADALGYQSDWAPMKDFKKVRDSVFKTLTCHIRFLLTVLGVVMAESP